LVSFFESFVATLISVFLNLKLAIIIKVFIYHHRVSISNRIKKTRLSLYCYKMVNKPRSLLSVLIHTCHGCHLTNMSQLFWIVISCHIARDSRKFKFFHKIAVIHEKFLVLLKLRRGPDKTRSRAGSGPRVVHPCCRLCRHKRTLHA